MRAECKNVHQASTLPSISDEYLLPVAVRKAGVDVKAEPWRRKAMGDSVPDPDQEAKAWRQAQLEQRHLEAYRNLHRLRDALGLRYAALLKDKVHSQRLLLQQRDETARAKSENETKRKQKKLAFSKLQHNDSYLKSLPKTSYYMVVLESRPAADLMTQISEKHPCTAKEREHEEHSRLLEQGSGSAELIFGGSQEKDEIEQMFPKMKAPTFATLQPNFMKNFQSKMPDLISPEIPEKSRKAEIYLRRLRQMHDLCLTNMASSQRLLDRETDSLCWQEERGNQDLMLPGIDSKQGKTSQTNQPPLCSPKQPRSVRNDQPSRPQQSGRMTSASHRDLETLVWDAAMCRRKTPDPLSIEDVCQQKHVEIIDRGFKLWRNYTENTDH
ncbi:hypothetical protein PFLUV_G00224670 [Perca fluviatilis]|uniref:Uncharacterized protein n=1 Tax=Perca fluviatilis TaxID=8168 RepID=A0A6A5EBY7_PERFL|nr:hypothetical protein PFLUV_G00224670 [Perca fluviatilis]